MVFQENWITLSQGFRVINTPNSTLLQYNYFSLTGHASLTSIAICLKLIRSCNVVTCSCTDESIYKIKGPVYTNLNIYYYYVEATALSLLVNRYSLSQKGSDIRNCGVDAISVYALYIDSTDSFLHKYSQ